jgi:purine-nucleoside phosphorylase
MQKSMVNETFQYLKARSTAAPLVGIVLGTGLNSLVDVIHDPVIIAYDSILNFPVSTVEFHKGNLIFGTINNVPVVAMLGRFHFYEGYSMQQITFPVRVMKELGIEYLLLSNAAGGINTSYKKGDLIITEDHINLLPDNPLRGLGNDFGNRFVDMIEPYDPDMIKKIEKAFIKENVEIKKGIYVSVMGPNLETRAEYRWLKNMGADMVGMSTVPEVIVANQLGIKCASISVITDECDPDNLHPVNIAEIIEVAGKADKKLSNIFVEVISRLPKSSAA